MTPLLFRHARVFDGVGFLVGPHDVRVEAGAITAVAPSSAGIDADGPVGQEVVDCTGRTLLPGLLDAHVHLMMSESHLGDIFTKAYSSPYYESVGHARSVLHSGVTTVRDAGMADYGMKDAIDRGIIEGPRMKVALTIVSMTGGHGDLWLRSGIDAEQFVETPGRPAGIADGPDELVRLTRRLFRAGADHIKICSSGGVLSPNDEPEHAHYSVAEIRAVVDEAADHGSYVMSHAIGATGIKRAVAAGVRSIEHGVFLDSDGVEQMLARDVYLVPTLTAPRQVIRSAEQGRQIEPAILEKAERLSQAHLENFSRAVDAGVRIAMGSDSGVGPHGQALEELALMADAGMSLERALAAATSVAAELLRESETVGSISPGHLADLVVLDCELDRAGQLAALPDHLAGVWKDGRRVR